MNSKKITVLEINAANNLSTGNIMLGIASVARQQGVEIYTASKCTQSAREVERERANKWHFLIGSRIENTLTRYFAWYTDFQDVGPIVGTYRLIHMINKIKPDIIHLHDIVGWYIDIGIFFRFLKKYDKPVIWTMHCCWAYTGRCIYYDSCRCEQWKDVCRKCPQLDAYPYSKITDRCSWNFKRKKRLFTGIKNLTIVTPSEWLKEEVEKSFLKNYSTLVINNGIDLGVFNPKSSKFRERHGLTNKTMILCVASAWAKRKGLDDVFFIANHLPEPYKVVIVGLSEKQIREAPPNAIALRRTKNIDELVEIYSAADLFVNTTYEDNYPTVNLEAQACGVPVITYKTGGSPESVDLRFGAVVKKGDVDKLISEIQRVCEQNSFNKTMSNQLVEMAKEKFSKEAKFDEYVEIYKKVCDR